MKKPLKIVLIVIGVLLLVLINVCVGAILINKDKTKKMLDDYSNIYTNDKYQEVVSVDNVNYIKQDVSCGYAVIEMFAKWRGNEEITEKYLYDKYGKVVTSTGKSFEEEMNKQFPEFKTTMYKNLNSSELIDKVYDSLLKGVPVPFEWAAKYEDKWTLHFSIITAMDIPNDKVTIMNPYGYEENISIKEFIDRTSFEAYDHMPIIFKLGFAFNLFEKNTIFIVDMPQVLDGTPSVGSGNRYQHSYNNNFMLLSSLTINGKGRDMPFAMYDSPDADMIIDYKNSHNISGDIVHIVYIMENSFNYTADMMFTVSLSDIDDEDKIDVYRYEAGKFEKLESRNQDDSVTFFTNKLGHFFFIRNK